MASPADIDDRLTAARQLMRQRQYAAAIEEYRRLLEKDDRDAAAHEGLATAAFMLKDYPLAIEHFKRVTLIDPRRSQPLVNLGAIYNRLGDYSAAVQTLRKALAKDNKCAEAYYNLGLAHRGLNQSSMAVSAYKEAIRLAPEMAEAYQNLGNVYVDMGSSQQAILQYERALQLRPDFERARQGLDRAREARQKAKDLISPFGRLVDPATQSRHSEQESAALRVMSDQERFEDRQAVYGHAKEAARAAEALLQLMQTELDTTLRMFSKAFSQSTEPRTYWNEYLALREAAKNFEQLLSLYQTRMDDLRNHEAFIAESLKKDAS